MKINFKGMMIGDGLCDPEMVCVQHRVFVLFRRLHHHSGSRCKIDVVFFLQMLGGYGEFLYQTGMIDEQQKEYVVKQTDKGVALIQQQKWVEAFQVKWLLMC